jgi:hypothetical protein
VLADLGVLALVHARARLWGTSNGQSLDVVQALLAWRRWSLLGAGGQWAELIHSGATTASARDDDGGGSAGDDLFEASADDNAGGPRSVDDGWRSGGWAASSGTGLGLATPLEAAAAWADGFLSGTLAEVEAAQLAVALAGLAVALAYVTLAKPLWQRRQSAVDSLAKAAAAADRKLRTESRFEKAFGRGRAGQHRSSTPFSTASASTASASTALAGASQSRGASHVFPGVASATAPRGDGGGGRGQAVGKRSGSRPSENSPSLPPPMPPLDFAKAGRASAFPATAGTLRPSAVSGPNGPSAPQRPPTGSLPFAEGEQRPRPFDDVTGPLPTPAGPKAHFRFECPGLTFDPAELPAHPAACSLCLCWVCGGRAGSCGAWRDHCHAHPGSPYWADARAQRTAQRAARAGGPTMRAVAGVARVGRRARETSAED